MHFSPLALALCLALLACSAIAQPIPPTEAPSTGLISAGEVTLSLWISEDCDQSSLGTFTFEANYSLCQSASAGGSTFYVRTDCYTNGMTKLGFCTTDCASCTDQPSAFTGVCSLTQDGGLVDSYTAICPTSPAFPAFIAPVEAPLNSTVPEVAPEENPQSGPATPESTPIAPVTTPDAPVPSMTPESVPQLVPESPAPAPSSASFASLSLLVIAFMLFGAIHSI